MDLLTEFRARRKNVSPGDNAGALSCTASAIKAEQSRNETGTKSSELGDMIRLKTEANRDKAGTEQGQKKRGAVEPAPTGPNQPAHQKEQGQAAITFKLWPDIRDVKNVKTPAQDYTECPSCGGRRWWISIYDVRICAKCHPPAAPELIARWEKEEEAPKEEEADRRHQGPSIDGSHRGGFMPPMLSGLNPLDMRRDPGTGEWVYDPGWWERIPKRGGKNHEVQD